MTHDTFRSTNMKTTTTKEQSKKKGRHYKAQLLEVQTDDGVVIGAEKLSDMKCNTLPQNYERIAKFRKPTNTLLKYIAFVTTVILATMLYCSYEIYNATQDTQINL